MISLILCLGLALGVLAAAPAEDPSNDSGWKSKNWKSNKEADKVTESEGFADFHTPRVRLMHPEGFVRSKSFYGFTEEETASSLMVIVAHEPVAKTLDRFSPESLKPRGMTLEGKEAATIDGRSCVLHHLLFKTDEGNFLKWAAVVGGEKEGWVITATFPADAEEEASNYMKQLVLETRFLPLAETDEASK